LSSRLEGKGFLGVVGKEAKQQQQQKCPNGTRHKGQLGRMNAPRLIRREQSFDHETNDNWAQNLEGKNRVVGGFMSDEEDEKGCRP
jgi:hypothetical protein